MGTLALAAKITHVPSMYLSELDGPRKGFRQAAIDGHVEIGLRCRELGVDTIVVFDTHWLVNANYHINCAPRFEGVYTSNELPHFISNLPYAFPGNPELGQLLAKACSAQGVETLAHPATTLAPEYGTLVPMRYMNADQHFKVVSVSALCQVHYLNDSARLGWAMRQAVEEHYDGTVAFLASGSLSHRFAQNGTAPDFATKIWSPFLETLDHRVAAGIEAGMCFVNSQNVRDLRQPFGGTKGSGTGREGGTWSYEVFLEPKNVAVSLGSHHIPHWGI